MGGMWYHVLNCGNRREAVFHKPGDYDAIIDARARLPLNILGYRLMPKYFHLVIRPRANGDPGRWVASLATRRHDPHDLSGNQCASDRAERP